MWKYLVFVGKLLLLGIVFLLPLFLFAWYHGRTESKSLRSIASFLAVDLSFFFCSFVGLCLDPKYQHLSLWERFIASLLVVLALTLIMIVTLPLRRLASSLFNGFFSR